MIHVPVATRSRRQRRDDALDLAEPTRSTRREDVAFAVDRASACEAHAHAVVAEDGVAAALDRVTWFAVFVDIPVDDHLALHAGSRSKLDSIAGCTCAVGPRSQFVPSFSTMYS